MSDREAVRRTDHSRLRCGEALRRTSKQPEKARLLGSGQQEITQRSQSLARRIRVDLLVNDLKIGKHFGNLGGPKPQKIQVTKDLSRCDHRLRCGPDDSLRHNDLRDSDSLHPEDQEERQPLGGGQLVEVRGQGAQSTVLRGLRQREVEARHFTTLARPQ